MNDTDHKLPDTSDTPEEAAQSRDAVTLRLNLATRLSYLKLYQAATRGLLERDAIPLVESFVEEEREAISQLDGQLRRLGYPIEVEVDAMRLIVQFRARRGTWDRLEFLQRGIVTSAEWYEARMSDGSLRPDVRMLFAGLGAAQRERAGRLMALLTKLAR